MTLEEQLQAKILNKYKSVMAFAKEIEVPYTTVKGMLIRGVSGTSVQTMIRVCKSLNIDIEALARGEVVETKEVSVVSELQLSKSEQEHIKKYRLIDQRGKQTVDDILEREYSYVKKADAYNIAKDMSEISKEFINQDFLKHEITKQK